MEECKIINLYNLEETIAKEFLEKYTYPWEALDGIGAYIVELGKSLPKEEYNQIGENVWIHKSAKVYNSAYIGENCIIGEGAEIRHCSFIRKKCNNREKMQW